MLSAFETLFGLLVPSGLDHNMLLPILQCYNISNKSLLTVHSSGNRCCRKCFLDISCASDLDINSSIVMQSPRVGINNADLDGNVGAPVRFVASTKSTPGPGVKSNLS